MKLYESSQAPNARRVRIFLAEKGIAAPQRVEIDIMKLEHKAEDFAARNPWRRVPTLVLDDGVAISESIAICRYFEALHPAPPLFGSGAKESALVEMWNRRMELGLFFSIASAFRHLHPRMAILETPQVKDWGETAKGKAVEEIGLLDEALADRPFICGEALTVADITAGVALDMLGWARIVLPESATRVKSWREALTARPSWSA